MTLAASTTAVSGRGFRLGRPAFRGPTPDTLHSAVPDAYVPLRPTCEAATPPLASEGRDARWAKNFKIA